MENRMAVPQKYKLELPYNPAVSLLGYLPEENTNTNSGSYMHSNFCGSIIYYSQDIEATWESTDTWYMNG